MRKSYSSKFKAKVALDVLRERDTVSEIASKYKIHRTLLSRWKKEVLDGLPDIFNDSRKKDKKEDQNLIEELYKQIGQLKVENDWLKKKIETINI